MYGCTAKTFLFYCLPLTALPPFHLEVQLTDVRMYSKNFSFFTVCRPSVLLPLQIEVRLTDVRMYSKNCFYCLPLADLLPFRSSVLPPLCSSVPLHYFTCLWSKETGFETSKRYFRASECQAQDLLPEEDILFHQRSRVF